MKGCEPRDLLDRITDICMFENESIELTPSLIDVAWQNYFGVSHSFSPAHKFADRDTHDSRERGVGLVADPLEL